MGGKKFEIIGLSKFKDGDMHYFILQKKDFSKKKKISVIVTVWWDMGCGKNRKEK